MAHLNKPEEQLLQQQQTNWNLKKCILREIKVASCKRLQNTTKTGIRRAILTIQYKFYWGKFQSKTGVNKYSI